MARVKLKVNTSSLSSLDLSGVADYIAAHAEKSFREDIGPHFVSVAKARAPVSEDRDFNPQRSSFRKLRLKPLGTFRPGGRADRLLELHTMSAAERADTVRTSDIEFFQGTGKNKGQTPDAIDVIRGTVQGAFRHRPGTLRDSIKIKDVKRTGNRVVLTVHATAPYALPVHEGFTHRGGPKHSGRATRIKGQKFLKSPLTNIRDRLKDPKTYGG